MTREKGWALITGASGGIGSETAAILARNGFNLILVARNEDKLKNNATHLTEAFGVEIRVCVFDLALPESAHALFDEVKHLDVTILVNNAGFGFLGELNSADWSHYRRMISLNNQTLVELTYLFIPHFKARSQRCYVLNVGSIAGRQGVPYFAVYAASKAFVNTFSEGLAWELDGTQITVTCLQPGKTRTDFFQASGVIEGHEKFTERAVMTASKVAEQGVSAMFKGELYVVTGMINKLSALLSNLVPKWMLKRTMRILFKEFSE